MKKILLLLLTFSTLSFGQTLTYEQLTSTKEKPKGKFTEYVSKDGSVYKIGDRIKIGVPSSNKTFAFITEGDGLLLPISPLSVSNSGQETEIKSIGIAGNKRSGFFIMFKTKSLTGLPGSGYNIQFENAVDNGEIKSFGMTSDEALAELKKTKDKLDLGIITQEQYDTKKSELLKYIK